MVSISDFELCLMNAHIMCTSEVSQRRKAKTLHTCMAFLLCECTIAHVRPEMCKLRDNDDSNEDEDGRPPGYQRESRKWM